MSASIQGNAVSFWAVEQSSPSAGVPATPNWDVIRRTSGDIDVQKSFTQSEEVDPTRQPGYNIITGSEVSGSIDAELSVADSLLEKFAQGALQSDSPAVVDATGSIDFDNATANISLTGAFSDAVEGQFIGAFDTASNNRIFRVVSVNSNDDVTVSPAPTDEVGVTGSLVGKSYRNSNVEKAFSMQKRIPTDSGTIYRTFEGNQINSLSINLSTESIVTLTYDLIGLSQIDGIAQISGATDNAVSTSRVSGSVKDITEFWIDGSPVDAGAGGVCYTDFSFSIENGAEGQPAIGKEGSCLISFDKSTVSGSLVSYVDGTNTTTAQSEVSKRDNETLFGLGVTFKDADGNYLVVNMPSAQYTELTQDETGNGDTLRNNGSFGATGKTEGYAVEFNFISAP